jgi:hypothetical protein
MRCLVRIQANVAKLYGDAAIVSVAIPGAKTPLIDRKEVHYESTYNWRRRKFGSGSCSRFGGKRARTDHDGLPQH